MAYTATITNVSPLDQAVLVSVEFTNGPNSVIPKNYSCTPGTVAAIKAELKPRVQADLAALNAKETAIEGLRLLIGTQVKDL